MVFVHRPAGPDGIVLVRLPRVPAGRYGLAARRAAARSRGAEVTVRAGETAEIRLALE